MRVLFFIIFLISFFLCQTIQARPLIIDTDVGPDDVIAILYLLSLQKNDIKAITIEGDGNAHCKPAFSNLKAILQLMGKQEIPVACGRATPLQGDHHFPAAILALCDTLGHVPLIKPFYKLPRETAKELLIATLSTSKEPLDIIAIAPMTTLAEVLLEKPLLKQKIHRIYAMGGAVSVPGNIHAVDPTHPNRSAEWNIYIDPYAAKIIFHSGIPITLVPLDITNTVLIDDDFYHHLEKEHTTVAADFVFQLLSHHKNLLAAKQWYFWDPMAAVIAMHPTLAQCKTMLLTIQLQPETISGTTVIDTKNGTPIEVCVDIQKEEFKKILLNNLNITK